MICPYCWFSVAVLFALSLASYVVPFLAQPSARASPQWPPRRTPSPTVLRFRPGGDTSEQRLDRGTDLLLHRVSDDRQQAPLSRHRSSLPLARDAIKTP